MGAKTRELTAKFDQCQTAVTAQHEITVQKFLGWCDAMNVEGDEGKRVGEASQKLGEASEKTNAKVAAARKMIADEQRQLKLKHDQLLAKLDEETNGLATASAEIDTRRLKWENLKVATRTKEIEYEIALKREADLGVPLEEARRNLQKFLAEKASKSPAAHAIMMKAKRFLEFK